MYTYISNDYLLFLELQCHPIGYIQVISGDLVGVFHVNGPGHCNCTFVHVQKRRAIIDDDVMCVSRELAARLIARIYIYILPV